jgi:excisionase family DNA binding protein
MPSHVVVPIRPLLTVEEVAKRLGCSEETVRRLCRRGRLPATRFSARGRLRVDVGALERFIEEEGGRADCRDVEPRYRGAA